MIFSSETPIDAIEEDLRYVKLLASKYPTIPDACTEIINLQAILNLPKGTEHFLTDIHGEYESFNHVLRNASGVIKRKINDIFGNSLRDSEKKELATLIYYPEQKLDLALKEEDDIDDWYKITLHKLIKICRTISSKYTRSKVRKALPVDFSYIIEELLHEQQSTFNKQEYYNGIIQTIIKIGRAKEFIIAISNLIQRLTVDRLHILGDIYDRGPGAHIILDTLMRYHSIDIQWGNHDILWMGAASGSESCIATVLRISTRYANLDTIEEGYGINLLPLATFALHFYKDDPCKSFKPKVLSEDNYGEKDLNLMSQMHKAISIIQFKLEGAIIKRRPNYEMQDRLLLDEIDYEKGIIKIEGKEYTLNDTNFPTIDPSNPYKLSEEERELIDKLKSSFSNSEKLQKHIRFLYSKGSMYLRYNSNLLYHGCVALTDDGSFKKMKIDNITYSGKSYIDRTERVAREAYFGKANSESKLYALDTIWYLWCGCNSPLFGKDRMTTFERYFINDKSAHTEVKNPYYKYRDDETICNNILAEFELNPHDSHIINGHVPVRTIQGESPIKANGKLLVIDGGFSKAYQPETGIAGYTLIYNSYGLLLASHAPFESTQKAIDEGKDILSSTIVLEKSTYRIRVIDTDVGLDIQDQIKDLESLLTAYRKGLIKEQRVNL
ncbi:fructose-1,6-bisphosphatase [Clostridium sp. CM028]|uniref:fructose-1,6-bisphosphatase n=1 Tax=unclassified Clostridium TaxID=2614128 RepID=UPI001C0CB1BA|nr:MULTISPECIES: fructose-1,6-bisphosphatase [unclassified Clostridium]MBU3093892.1 fructose-1,6-bisphosphatase [Clostridium sp. CF011]MBW9147195.1 fructose-1,6-bisphosphatase [Clostridium sp. CM027]MBW9150352.1 fructose-1,6-bisphosphatase [Clostridium sp. CM028]UVE39733.1 fructose-1,6-bisphosphatase [Clostridium sp. CM027]WAG68640.1 fructose-1,6-bisphosphatase [Clostridium sp. CF011]